jgi:capsular polysaccharide biosynthesis protein
MELDLKKMVFVLRRRLWFIVFFVAVSSAAGWIISEYFIPPVYQASSKLMVTKSNEPNLGQLDIEMVTLNIKLIETYKAIIKTPAIMDIVVQQNPQIHLTAQQLMNIVKVSSINETPVMNLTVQNYSYPLAVDIVNAVARVFKEQIPLVMKIDNITILDEAKYVNYPTPVKPIPEANAVIAFLVSLLVSVSFVIIREALDDSLKSEEDILIYLDAPTLAVFAEIDREDWNAKNRKQKVKRSAEIKGSPKVMDSPNKVMDL